MQVQMNIAASALVGRAVLCTPRDVTSDGRARSDAPYHAKGEEGASLKMITSAPDRPGTGTKGKSSRARNISRRL